MASVTVWRSSPCSLFAARFGSPLVNFRCGSTVFGLIKTFGSIRTFGSMRTFGSTVSFGLSSFSPSSNPPILSAKDCFLDLPARISKKYYYNENVYLTLATMRSWHFLLSSGILNIRLAKQIVGKRPEWSDSNLIGPDSDSGFQNGMRCNKNYWSVTSIQVFQKWFYSNLQVKTIIQRINNKIVIHFTLSWTKFNCLRQRWIKYSNDAIFVIKEGLY